MVHSPSVYRYHHKLNTRQEISHTPTTGASVKEYHNTIYGIRIFIIKIIATNVRHPSIGDISGKYHTDMGSTLLKVEIRKQISIY